MNGLGTPDLVTSSQLSRTLSRVNADLTRASEELTTGLKSNPIEASGGDPVRLYSIRREIALNAGYATSISLTAGRAGAMQSALGRLEGAASEVGVALLASAAREDFASAVTQSKAARGAFEEAIAALNSRFADRALFGGAATSSAALASADDILAEISARVASSTDATSALAAIDDYFADPSGFASTGYLGSSEDAPEAEVAVGERISLPGRADGDAAVATLRALAIGVIGAEGGYPDDDSIPGRLLIFKSAGQAALEAKDAVIALRSELGIAEERIELSKIRNEAEASFLSTSLNNFIARNQFEAASEFTALETQIQSVFSVTARLSGLSIVNFLR